MTTPTTANSAAGMLKMLGSSGAGPMHALSTHPAKADIATAGFAELLGLAKSGDVSSGREVSIDPGLDVDLTPDQRKALAEAADRAEAAGLNRALVMIGGRALVLDVASRSVTAAADLSSPTVLSQIDGVVSAATKDGQGAALLMPPASAIGNRSLAQVLAPSEANTPTQRA